MDIMKPKKNQCPLKFSGPQEANHCEREACMWFFEEQDNCAVPVLAGELKKKPAK